MTNVQSAPRDYVQRRYLRLPIRVPAVSRIPAGPQEVREVQGTVRYISAGGLMLELPTYIPPATHVGVTIQAKAGPVPVEGQVIWARAWGSEFQHGLAFPQPKDADFAINLFIEESR